MKKILPRARGYGGKGQGHRKEEQGVVRGKDGACVKCCKETRDAVGYLRKGFSFIFVCAYACSAQGGQKREADPLGLE